MNRKHVRLAVVALWALAPMATAQGTYKIVVHPSNSETSLNKADVSRQLLKKATRWSDGTKVMPVDLERASQTRAAFSGDVHRKSPDAIAAYWQKQIFSGRGLPPLVKNSDAEVLDYVRANPGAVGYVSAGTPTGGVKVVEIR